MARYYRRRYTRTLVRPKKKWASNIITWNNSQVDTLFINIVANKAQTPAPTPTVIKTGNFKISCDLVLNGATGTHNPTCTIFIIYVPEGWTQTYAAYVDLVEKHPEWILACKSSGGSITTSQTGAYSVDSINLSSRMKRNLNSGDSIGLLIMSNITSSNAARITGVCRWWTCAN